MRLLMAIFTLVAITSTAQAGDNGVYLACASESGLTVLNVGNIGSGLNPRTVQFSIEGKTLGDLVVGQNVDEITVGKLTMYKDLASNEVVLAVKSLPNLNQEEVASDITRVQIIKGMDPRKGKELDFNIDLMCRIVENPI